MFDKRLEINHQIHDLVADAFNHLVNKYDVSKEDRAELHETLAEVDKLVERKDNMELSDQPTKPSSKDIIRALLNSGQRYVPCYVSSDIEAPNDGSYLDFIICVKGDGRFYNQFGRGWKYATPFDLKTGQPITEMPV